MAKLANAEGYSNPDLITEQNSTVQPNKEHEGSNLDRKLDKVDEEKFQKYVKMVDYIKENGGEYEEEYKNIVNSAIEPFEKQIGEILYKSNTRVDVGNIMVMSKSEAKTMADEIMKDQPDKFNKFSDLISVINGNGSPEEIQKLNEIVNENMADVQDFYKKITEKNDNSNVSPFDYEYFEEAA